MYMIMLALIVLLFPLNEVTANPVTARGHLKLLRKGHRLLKIIGINTTVGTLHLDIPKRRRVVRPPSFDRDVQKMHTP